MINVADITTEHWSLSIDKPGEIVTDLNDIDQCIHIIMTTDRGSDPLRPEFGSNVYRLLDKPINNAIPLMLKEISDAIEIWEPRAEIETIAYQIEVGKVTLTVLWKPAGIVVDSLRKTEATYNI